MLNKRIPKPVKHLSYVSLFTDIASEMLYPITPIFLTSILGASISVVGALEGAAEIISGFLKGYFGALSDKIKKRSLFVKIGYALSALSKPFPGLFPYISAVVGSRITDRVGKGMRTAPRDALLASYAKENTGAIFGFHRGMDTLGAALGPLLALALLYFYNNNYQLIFLIAFIPSLIAVTFTFLIKDNFTSETKKGKNKYSVFWHSASADYKFLLILITVFSLVNSSDVFLILKSKSISGSSTLAILGYVFYNIVYAVFSYPLGKLSDKYGKKKIFVIGLFIFSLVYLGFAKLNSVYILWILFAFYGIYAASTEGIVKAWISDLITDEFRGTAIGLLTMCSSLAIMLGSFLAGVLWDQFGSQVPFLISSVVSFVIVIILIVNKKI
ncbi:MAG: MFS transporter [Ignavibacteriales bacterium CG_4_9_14_3_um_filter_30_11]|nr:MAG: MFS transporter [Ignavibacteriales bacterium CG_4_9_14_3_um_filter_30_11]